MTAGEHQKLLALFSWAYWTGQKEIIDTVIKEGTDFFIGKPADIKTLFLKLADNLFSPPSADISKLIPRNFKASSDEMYRQISQALDIPPKPFWPDSHPCAFIFSYDIDRIRLTYQDIWAHLRKGEIKNCFSSFIKFIKRCRKDTDEDPYRNLKRILEKEKEWSIRSVIFILKEKRRLDQLLRFRPQHFFGVYNPKEIAEEVEALRAHGDELALHISLDGFFSGKAMREEKEFMENLWPVVFQGARTHYLRFSKKTPDLLMKEGFSYDSSMGFNFNIGFRCGTAFPFILNSRGTQLLWEIPFHIMDTALMHREGSLGNKTGLEQVSLPLLDHIMEIHGMLVVNWHQRHLNKKMEADYFELLESMIFRFKEKDAWFTTPGALLHWWFKERPQS